MPLLPNRGAQATVWFRNGVGIGSSVRKSDKSSKKFRRGSELFLLHLDSKQPASLSVREVEFPSNCGRAIQNPEAAILSEVELALVLAVTCFVLDTFLVDILPDLLSDVVPEALAIISYRREECPRLRRGDRQLIEKSNSTLIPP